MVIWSVVVMFIKVVKSNLVTRFIADLLCATGVANSAVKKKKTFGHKLRTSSDR